MLNLVDRLSAMGRNYRQVGRSQEALHIFSQLAQFRNLPAAVAEETQANLAEITLERKDYRQARRHLAAALCYQPENIAYHNMMASALDNDDDGDDQRAARHYRKSLQLDPHQPEQWSEYGLLLLRLGRTETGLKALRKAAAQAPADPEVLRKLITGLLQAEGPEEARQVLRAARFRNAGDRRFQDLWNDFQFQELHRRQQAGDFPDSRDAAGAALPILPFVCRETARSTPTGEEPFLRHDAPATLPAPHPTQPAWLPDERHA
jgi:tetratricopeptide (TPR) repeat protein